MVEIRAIFGDDDRENEQFLGFYLDNIEEAEERYIRQIDALNDFDRPTLTFLIQKKKKIGTFSRSSSPKIALISAIVYKFL
jgi:hypothetical protein